MKNYFNLTAIAAVMLFSVSSFGFVSFSCDPQVIAYQSQRYPIYPACYTSSRKVVDPACYWQMPSKAAQGSWLSWLEFGDDNESRYSACDANGLGYGEVSNAQEVPCCRAFWLQI